MAKKSTERSLRSRLDRGDRLSGVVVKMPAPALVEACGYAGFDFVIIDCEHGPADTVHLHHHLRAAAAVDLPALVRIGGGSDEILRAMDGGAQGVIAPHITTAQEAADLVVAAHYPPVGRRGLALSTRAGRHTLGDLNKHLRAARESTLVVAQIEDAEAVDRASSIAKVDHLDMVFLGPSDLMLSLGYPGQKDAPAVKAAVKTIVAEVAANETRLGAFVSDEYEAEEWFERGAVLVAFAASALFAQRLQQVAMHLGLSAEDT